MTTMNCWHSALAMINYGALYTMDSRVAIISSKKWPDIPHASSTLQAHWSSLNSVRERGIHTLCVPCGRSAGYSRRARRVCWPSQCTRCTRRTLVEDTLCTRQYHVINTFPECSNEILRARIHAVLNEWAACVQWTLSAREEQLANILSARRAHIF